MSEPSAVRLPSPLFFKSRAYPITRVFHIYAFGHKCHVGKTRCFNPAQELESVWRMEANAAGQSC